MELYKRIALLFVVVLLILIGIVARNERQIDIIRYVEHAKDSVVGDFKYSTRTADFHGWYICDGRSLSRSVYHHLFRVIGTTYGSVDANSFNLPDARGRVIGLSGQSTGLPHQQGDTTGEETHTMTLPELVSHTHTGTIATSGQHTHTGTVDASGQHTHSITDPGHSHTQTTINDDFNNSGSSPPGFTRDSAGLMTWNNINASATGITINSDGSHTHTFTSDASGNHNHTISISNTGSTQPFNVMQPTLFVGNLFIFVGVEFSCHPHPTLHP